MDRFDWRMIPGGGGRDGAPIPPQRIFLIGWGVVALIVVLWGVLTSFYTVEASEEALVLRFGRFHEITGPGFHGKLPFGIDEVLIEKVKTIHREEFGYRTLDANVRSTFDTTSRRVVSEATVLTGDLNLVLVNWEVRFKIRDLRDYLFQVRNPRETLRDVSQAIMRTEVGDRSVDEVLALDRITMENEVEQKMQMLLDGFRCGIHVVKVNLKSLGPPDPVRDAFNAVEEAKQTKDRIINEAEGMRNQKVPAARGAADKAVKEAEGYRVGIINRARGDTQAFLRVLAEYEKAKDVTRRRLYLEAMEDLLPRVGKITLVDGEQGDIFKLLDLKTRKGE